MYEPRIPSAHRAPSPRDQFRCHGCRRFVRGTEHGVCPHCGLAPPAINLVGSSQTGLAPSVRTGWSPRLRLVVLYVCLGIAVMAFVAMVSLT